MSAKPAPVPNTVSAGKLAGVLAGVALAAPAKNDRLSEAESNKRLN